MELEVISSGREINVCVCSRYSELSCALCLLKWKCCSSFPGNVQLSIGSACACGTVDKLWTLTIRLVG